MNILQIRELLRVNLTYITIMRAEVRMFDWQGILSCLLGWFALVKCQTANDAWGLLGVAAFLLMLRALFSLAEKFDILEYTRDQTQEVITSLKEAEGFKPSLSLWTSVLPYEMKGNILTSKARHNSDLAFYIISALATLWASYEGISWFVWYVF
ncbi:MAG: hypothetical protein WCV86_01985 [Patescibacteria group bacterium]|jgi:hypothetical protein